MQLIDQLDENISLLHVWGNNKIRLLNYQKILYYNQKEIKIKLNNKIIIINGENLVIKYFDKDEMMIGGQIDSIMYQKL